MGFASIKITTTNFMSSSPYSSSFCFSKLFNTQNQHSLEHLAFLDIIPVSDIQAVCSFKFFLANSRNKPTLSRFCQFVKSFSLFQTPSHQNSLILNQNEHISDAIIWHHDWIKTNPFLEVLCRDCDFFKICTCSGTSIQKR